jgi:hypothetical protein
LLAAIMTAERGRLRRLLAAGHVSADDIGVSLVGILQRTEAALPTGLGSPADATPVSTG